MRLCLLVLHSVQKSRASPHFLSPFELWKKLLSNFHIGSIVVSKLSFLFWKNESWSHRARSIKKNPQWDGDFSIDSFYSASFEDMNIISDIDKNQNFLYIQHPHKFLFTFPSLFPHLRNKRSSRKAWYRIDLEEVYILAIISPIKSYNSLCSDIFTDSQAFVLESFLQFIFSNHEYFVRSVGFIFFTVVEEVLC